MTIDEIENGDYIEKSKEYLPKTGFVVFPENREEEMLIEKVLTGKEAFELLLKEAIKRYEEG